MARSLKKKKKNYFIIKDYFFSKPKKNKNKKNCKGLFNKILFYKNVLPTLQTWNKANGCCKGLSLHTSQEFIFPLRYLWKLCLSVKQRSADWQLNVTWPAKHGACRMLKSLHEYTIELKSKILKLAMRMCLSVYMVSSIVNRGPRRQMYPSVLYLCSTISENKRKRENVIAFL